MPTFTLFVVNMLGSSFDSQQQASVTQWIVFQCFSNLSIAGMSSASVKFLGSAASASPSSTDAVVFLNSEPKRSLLHHIGYGATTAETDQKALGQTGGTGSGRSSRYLPEVFTGRCVNVPEIASSIIHEMMHSKSDDEVADMHTAHNTLGPGSKPFRILKADGGTLADKGPNYEDLLFIEKHMLNPRTYYTKAP